MDTPLTICRVCGGNSDEELSWHGGTGGSWWCIDCQESYTVDEVDEWSPAALDMEIPASVLDLEARRIEATKVARLLRDEVSAALLAWLPFQEGEVVGLSTTSSEYRIDRLPEGYELEIAPATAKASARVHGYVQVSERLKSGGWAKKPHRSLPMGLIVRRTSQAPTYPALTPERLAAHLVDAHGVAPGSLDGDLRDLHVKLHRRSRCEFGHHHDHADLPEDGAIS